jgi:hypothetical protein
MKKTDAQEAFPALLEAWINETNQNRSKLDEALFSSFYGWLSSNHPLYTRFRSRMTARDDLEVWFDEATGQLWKR